MNTYQTDKAISAISRLSQETKLPEYYTNDLLRDEKTLLAGDVAEQFGFVLRTCGTHLDNPCYRLGGEHDHDARVLASRHRILGGSGVIRYFWYRDGHFTEVTLDTYIQFFALARVNYAQGEEQAS